MVVQTIQISFSSFAADTIRIHTGETGREILFVPDMEISGNYSADFIVIKPDDTFVIAAATITDGEINVEIPEQAGAVAGAGHYILKIYDTGEVCIYSASGGFMVDDHLLSDGMIESIADVYGYQFPQDFALKNEAATLNDNVTATNSTWSSSKISEEIEAATPEIIDDENVLYDKTWSSEKISYELGNIQPFHVYSTTEQPVGRWINGKILYEMTFVGQSVTNTNWSIDVSTLGIETAFIQSGFVMLSNNIPININEYFSTANYSNAHYENNYIRGNLIGYTGVPTVTIRYTKVTE